MIFKTLRTGFPNARITVVDNASLAEVRGEIETLALENDCSLQQISAPGVRHHDFIQNTIRAVADDKNSNGPLIFLDPDICFWSSCEDFSINGLMAGQVKGKHHEYMFKTVTMPRIHSSFLWITDARELLDVIRKIRIQHFDFEPFLPFSFYMDGRWYRYDTGAGLYAAIADKVHIFTEEQLDCYDHIYCGSHLDWLFPLYDQQCRQLMHEVHTYAKEGNLQALKGIRKYQERIFTESFTKAT